MVATTLALYIGLGRRVGYIIRSFLPSIYVGDPEFVRKYTQNAI